MRGAITTLKKELLSYAVSPVSWIIAFLFYLIRGSEVSNIVYYFATFRADVNQFPAATYGVNSTFNMVLLVPGIVTMRCFAEERRTGSIETLMTAPLRDAEVVIGKWLAATVFFGLLWLPSVFLLHILEYPDYFNADISFGPVFSAYLGMFLLSGFLLAFGCFASSLTDNVLLAAIVTILFSGAMVNGRGILVRALGEWRDNYYARELLAKMDVQGNFSNWFARGLIDTSQVAFYLGGIGFFLFLTWTSLTSRRLA
ncbi:MAG: ABC-2 type transport system permease protein [Planctomycetota bacterium]|jgi:ABC-2 type transport system permease protein